MLRKLEHNLIKKLFVGKQSAFLLVNLIVGISYRGKLSSFQDYVIGNKQFPAAVLTATLAATWASASLFFIDLEQTYTIGLHVIIPRIAGGSLGLPITGYLLGHHLAPSLHQVSIPAVLGSMYGQIIQVLIPLTTGYIIIQFKVITKISAVSFNSQGNEIIIILATIIIIYAAFGGIKAVFFRYVIQFITFGMLSLTLIIWTCSAYPLC